MKRFFCCCFVFFICLVSPVFSEETKIDYLFGVLPDDFLSKWTPLVSNTTTATESKQPFFLLYENGTTSNGDTAYVKFFITEVHGIICKIPAYISSYGEEKVDIAIQYGDKKFECAGYFDSRNYYTSGLSTSNVIVKPGSKQNENIFDFAALYYAFLNYDVFDVVISCRQFRINTVARKLEINESTANSSTLACAIIANDVKSVQKILELNKNIDLSKNKNKIIFKIDNKSIDLHENKNRIVLEYARRLLRSTTYKKTAQEIYDSMRIAYLIKKYYGQSYITAAELGAVYQKITEVYEADSSGKRGKQVLSWFARELLVKPTKENLELAHALFSHNQKDVRDLVVKYKTDIYKPFFIVQDPYFDGYSMNYSKKEESIFQRFYCYSNTLSDFFELEAVAKPLTDYESLNGLAHDLFRRYIKYKAKISDDECRVLLSKLRRESFTADDILKTLMTEQEDYSPLSTENSDKEVCARYMNVVNVIFSLGASAKGMTNINIEDVYEDWFPNSQKYVDFLTLMAQHGFNLRLKDEYGNSLLVRIVNYLIKNSGERKCTQIDQCYEPIVRFLLANGLSVNEKGGAGKSALELIENYELKYGALDWFEANFTINPQKVNTFTLIKNAAAN